MLHTLDTLVRRHGLTTDQLPQHPPALVGIGERSWRLPEETMTHTIEPHTVRRASVLMLFGNDANYQPALLFVRRAAHLRQNPGQIAFPGGKMDRSDSSTVFTALREANEETGLDPQTVSVRGALTEIELPLGNFLITTVIAHIDRLPTEYAFDRNESDSVFTIPLDELANVANRGIAVVDDPRNNLRRRTRAFHTPEGVIWGFTANLLEILLTDLGHITETSDREINLTAPH